MLRVLLWIGQQLRMRMYLELLWTWIHYLHLLLSLPLYECIQWNLWTFSFKLSRWIMWSQGLDFHAHGKWRKLINWCFCIISVNVPLQLFVVAALGSSISVCKHFEHVFKVAWERGKLSFPLFSFIIPRNMKDSFMFSYGVQCFWNSYSGHVTV